jgi:hypothetical protein
MVSGIEAGAFEDYADRCDHLLQRLLPALRAGFKRRILKGLLALELDAAVLTAIGINRHNRNSFFALTAGVIIARSQGEGKPTGSACYNFLIIVSFWTIHKAGPGQFQWEGFHAEH